MSLRSLNIPTENFNVVKWAKIEVADTFFWPTLKCKPQFVLL
jgi:hypothetical protein